MRAPKLVFAANGHAIALAAKDEGFRAASTRADIIHADGQAAVFASQLLTSTPIPERSATTDFIHDAARAAAEHGLRFFLLGATEEANAKGRPHPGRDLSRPWDRGPPPRLFLDRWRKRRSATRSISPSRM